MGLFKKLKVGVKKLNEEVAENAAAAENVEDYPAENKDSLFMLFHFIKLQKG